jgi:hypothetical protein
VTQDQFEAMLRAWGSYYGENRGPEWDEADGCNAAPVGGSPHPLERARAFAPGTRRAALEAMHLRRAGRERRAMMGAAAGLAGPLPAEFVDPIPCVETRPVAGTPRPDPRYTDAVRAVQEAWLVLREWWPLQAEIVRLHYQVRGFTQAEKAELVSASFGDAVGLKRFKDELRLARVWLHARLAR